MTDGLENLGEVNVSLGLPNAATSASKSEQSFKGEGSVNTEFHMTPVINIPCQKR